MYLLMQAGIARLAVKPLRPGLPSPWFEISYTLVP